MERFLAVMAPTRESTILDVGGTPDFWAGTSLNVTLLNIRDPGDILPHVTHVPGDATDIPFSDGAFDIVFSNSMIEHLHTLENQSRAAREAARVGRKLWIQTPNRWFPVEPHHLTPAIHWLPKPLQRRLLRNCSVWGLIARPSAEYVEQMVDEIRLLAANDLRTLFPGCEILRERLIGLTKSLIVVRR
jgi:SAM-dependent methyltransferase